MENLPLYILITFVLTTLLGLYFLWRASRYSLPVLAIAVAWLALPGGLAASGFFTVSDTIPPRIMLALVPTIVTIVTLFATQRGRTWIDTLDQRTLALLHVLRIPVEIVLLWLSIHMVLPEMMTFEGRNFDIFSGLTAPLIWYFGYVRGKLGRGILLTWNFLCLALVLNVVIHGILAVPSPLQQIAFDQPNIAVLHFPYVWLPSFLVPLVIFAHLAAIRGLLRVR